MPIRGKEKVLEAIAELEKSEIVYSAEPDYRYETIDLWVPNDTNYATNQWGLTGTNGIQAANTWDMTRGLADIRVGLFETGAQQNHPDLNGRFLAPNFTLGNADHGTHVAGIVGAISNNNQGVAGVSQSNMMLLNRNSNDFVDSMARAANNNIWVINASYEYTSGGVIENHAVVIHNYQGLLVCAAGNSTADIDNATNRRYPAGYSAYTIPRKTFLGIETQPARPITNVITVGSIDNGGGISSFSNWGETHVQLFAPGGNILSTFPEDRCALGNETLTHPETGATITVRRCESWVSRPGGLWARSSTHHADGYHFMSGTSMAAPHVAGVAALIRAINQNLTPQQIKAAILDNVDTATGLSGLCSTGGRLNAHKALASVALQHTTSSGNVTITGRNFNPTGALVLPDTINGNTVTAIGSSAFSNATGLSQITIPASVTSIGNSAFCGCTSLSSVSIPSSVTHIGIEAFNPSTVLTSFGGNRANIDLVVVDGTKDTYIANGWTGFNIVELSATGPLTVTSGQLRGTVEIPPVFNNRSITSIGDNGFANQSQLTGISIMSVASIGNAAFSNCSNLEGVGYYSFTGLASTPNHSTSYSNDYYTERCLDVNLSAGYTCTLSFDYSNLTASTDVSNVFTSLGVGESTFAVDLPVQKAFSSTSGTQVIVFTPTEAQLATSNKLWCRFIRTGTPQTVSINISNVEIEAGMTDVSVDAFRGCDELATPALSYNLLPNNTYEVTGIANESGWVMLNLIKTLFIPSVYWGKEVTQIAPSAFAGDDFIRWVFIQSGISSVGNRAFQFCSNLETVDMYTTSVTSIEDYTFDVCTPSTLDNELNEVQLPNGLISIGEGAFIRTKMSIDIPHSVTSIGSYAFAYGDRTSFRLPNNLITIGAYAFAHSEPLMLGYIGSSLTTIGERAFYNTSLPALTEIFPSVTTIGAYAFCNSSFYTNFALPTGSQLTSIGNYAFRNINLTRIVIPSSITSIGQGAFSGNASLTIYTERTSKPSTWNSYWNSSNRPVVWGCTLSSDKTYVLSFTKNSFSPSNPGATNGITDPYRKNYTFGGWYTTSNFSGNPVESITSVGDNTILYAKWNKNSCVAEETLITLADGSQVAVEDLTGEESLLVWNMVTGTFDSAPILFIDSDPYTEYEIIHLYFSDGTEVKGIYEHAFWDIDLNEYVFLRNDAAQYVGHWFNKQTDEGNGNMVWTAVQLVDVEIYDENTTAWSPVTFGHLCYYVNGMLSMPGATEGLINIFEVDRTTMQYDETSFATDIATYGLFTYEEFAEIIPIPEVIFEAFNGQYLKVSIGKGLITMGELVALIEHYADFFTEEEDNTPEVHDDQNGHGNHHGHHNGQGNSNNGNGKGSHNNGHYRRGR